MEEPRREPWRTAYGRPLARLELPGLAQDGRVDGDLAEIVQPAGPTQARHLRGGHPECRSELCDMCSDADRVPVRRGVALVDDVRERLECARDLAPRHREASVCLLDQQGDR